MRDERFYSENEIPLTLNNLTERNLIVDF
jgi:hypothetical protein